MHTNEDHFVVSVDELVRIFQSALVALVPAAERARMIWADVMNQHYEWEKIQIRLFKSFVAQPIEVDRGRLAEEYPLAPYDIDSKDYSRLSWIGCRAERGGDLTFVRLVTRSHPFDVVEAVEVNSETGRVVGSVEIPFVDARFFYVRRAPGGDPVRVDQVEAVE